MSTYSTTLRLELIGAGQQDGTWGDTTNSNLGDLIEAAITNTVDITFANATYTLTAYNGLPDEARNAVLNLIGTNSAQQNLVAPAVQKTYIVKNDTGANVAITAGGANVVIQDGSTALVYCDGTDFFPGALPYGAGTGSGSVVYSNGPTVNSPTFTGTPVAPTAAVGTDTTQIATTAFVRDIIPTGLISLWYGSVASVPSGWYLCDGTNGTPDLRSRFIVGAGSTYAVGATGGSADAITVAHTHTATSTASGGSHYHLLYAATTSNTESSGSPSLYAATRGDFGGSYFNQNVGPTSTVADTIRSASADSTPSVSTTVASSGSSGTNANLPPYYALAYIMKA